MIKYMRLMKPKLCYTPDIPSKHQTNVIQDFAPDFDFNYFFKRKRLVLLVRYIW